MSEFNIALQKTLANEGGFVNDPDDSGGETYKGIARNFHENWSGWNIIDSLKSQTGFPDNLNADQNLQAQVTDFYKLNFWNPIHGDDINSQLIADSIYDFAVNAGVGTSSKLAQESVGAVVDGIIGPNTIRSINGFNEEDFRTKFALEKVKYYTQITEKRPANQKFFFGWIRRTLKDLQSD